MRHFRKEFWLPELIDRENFQGWEQKGKTTLLDRVKAKVKRVVETHEPEPLEQRLFEHLQDLAKKDHTKTQG